MKSSAQTFTVGLTVFLVGLGISGLTHAQSGPPQPRLDGSSLSTNSPTSSPQTGQIIPAGDMSLPPQGIPGNCYARVWEPPVYGTETDTLLAKQASERIEILPAQYGWVEQKVLVREAYERQEVVPAVYGTESERILVKPATTRWKKGRGLVEKVNNFTGEIMCLVEVPAEYKTVTTRVVKTPATTRLVPVPAEYKTVKIQKLIKPRQEKRIPISAEYQTVERTVLKSPGRMAWKSVLCETNAPADLKATPVKAAAPPAITSINTQSKSSATTKGDDDWFFMWDYDTLFNDGKLVPAEREYPFIQK